jgi:hypothetical protein
MWHRCLFLIVALASVALYVGCGSSPPGAPPAAGGGPQEVRAKAEPKPEEHEHLPGAHGGTIVPLGRDSYHVEAVVEKGGVLRLYTLGKDEARVQEVERQTLTAYVKRDGGEAVAVPLEPEPQPGDAAGKTSQFVGRLPRELWGKSLVVTVPSLTIAGERFRLGFTHDSHPEQMPASVAGTDAERQLFLTPGGAYTAADIQANGGVTASEKYHDFQAAHDTKPKAGDAICPVTLTKANKQCTWVVGGQTYEFCCPPCIEEFVKTAKEQPAAVKPPAAYRQD